MRVRCVGVHAELVQQFSRSRGLALRKPTPKQPHHARKALHQHHEVVDALWQAVLGAVYAYAMIMALIPVDAGC